MTSQFWVESRSQRQIQRIKIFEDNLGKYPYDHWPGKDTLKQAAENNDPKLEHWIIRYAYT